MKFVATWLIAWILSAAFVWMLGAMVFGLFFILGMDQPMYRLLTNTTSLVLGGVMGFVFALKARHSKQTES